MKRQFKPDCRRVKAGLSGTALALAVSSFLTFQSVQPVQAADEPPASGAADFFAGMDSPAPGGGDYESRLSYHRDNKGDLRIPPIAAADRRRAIPNDNRPPLQREPSVKLPPLPADMENVVRRVNIPGGEKVCALTFDLCELATLTTGFDADIVGWLQDQSIPATLFMGGKWMRTHAKRVKQIMRDPLFEIGNHAWSHGNFGIMPPERMREEIQFTQAEYEELRQQSIRESSRDGTEGIDPPQLPQLFRFPYGRCNDESLKLVAQLGLRAIQWDVVAETGGNNANLEQGRHVASMVKPGSILLFNANLVPKGSFQLLRYVVGTLKMQGYRFVCVGELLNMGKPEVTRDGYFLKPGDNKALDTRFGPEGTGR